MTLLKQSGDKRPVSEVNANHKNRPNAGRRGATQFEVSMRAPAGCRPSGALVRTSNHRDVRLGVGVVIDSG